MDRNMNRIESLKQEVPLDFFVVAMLYHGAGVSQVSQRLNISRQQVYNARNRVKELLLKYGLLDISEPVE